MAHDALRRKLIHTTQEMARLGLNTGTAGNASVRAGAGYLVTPTGMDYAGLKPADITAMDFEGRATGRRAPSSEWPFHGDILKARPEFGAVLHAHPPHATALACLGKPIPAFHYMVAVAGGADIRCAAYATFGSRALSRHALAALEDRRACLLANHGMISCGADLDAALALAVEVETLARQYLLALSAGRPQILPAREMAKVIGLFKSYGRQPDRAAGRNKRESGKA
ncbi:MAG: class II aldolase/adducin family protein [Alphaproteobacteria bacterium]|nr:class II aldolase/adducin family protein [Alphaproteobacteria bacterium]